MEFGNRGRSPRFSNSINTDYEAYKWFKRVWSANQTRASFKGHVWPGFLSAEAPRSWILPCPIVLKPTRTPRVSQIGSHFFHSIPWTEVTWLCMGAAKPRGNHCEFEQAAVGQWSFVCWYTLFCWRGRRCWGGTRKHKLSTQCTLQTDQPLSFLQIFCANILTWKASFSSSPLSGETVKVPQIIYQRWCPWYRWKGGCL